MNEHLVYYRYNGVTNTMCLLAESEEIARERVLVFRANNEEPHISYNGEVSGPWPRPEVTERPTEAGQNS